jgi:protein-tyrosine phosphatase
LRFSADSAGMGDWHCGEPPDPRASTVAARHGVHLPSICRQVSVEDFGEFDLILAMDRSNRDALLARCPASLRHKVRLMRDFDPETTPEAHPEVPDPYHGNEQGFERVFAMLHRSCTALLDRLEKDGVHGLAAGPRA